MAATDAAWTAPQAPGPLDALIRVPGSKSLTARWLVLAALAAAPCTLRDPLSSRDTRAMIDALTLLGAGFEQGPGTLRVTPLSAGGLLSTGAGEPRDEPRPVTVHAGLAGTVSRFIPIVAALHRGDVTVTGDAPLLRRPMGPVIAALRAQGIDVAELGEAGHLPIMIRARGSLPGGLVEIDASSSSQFVSSLLLAGARAETPLVVRHVGASLPSLPHIEMTMAVLEQAGVACTHRTLEAGIHEWRVDPGPIGLDEVAVEPDLSNAGPFLAAALVAGGTIAIADWPERTHQPGDAYRDLLARMGGRIEREDTDLCASGTGRIRGLDADLSAVGELVPTIAALAALAETPSHLRGIGHLRGHETDRIHALAVELERLGARTVEHPDSLEIHPGPLHGATVQTYDDHRLATAAAIIALRVPQVRVVNVETTQKTLPDFVGMWTSMLHTDCPAGQTW